MKAENVRKIAAQVLLALVPLVSWGQSCNSTGADGAYSPTVSGPFNPVALNLNAAGDNVFNFTSITIPVGVIITMPAHLMKSQRPVVFLSSGPVNINGTLDISGADGQAGSLQFYSRTPSEPGAGGYPGGVGGRPNSTPGPGTGPGGAKVPSNNGYGCSASYSALATNSIFQSGCANASSTYGNALLLPLVGGSGGSGGGSSNASYSGGSGGAGGGALRICSDVSITMGEAGQLLANGGVGGAAATNDLTTGAGGGGSGGAIHLQAPSVTEGIIISAMGAALTASPGSPGRIRIDTNNLASPSIGLTLLPVPLVGPFLPGPYGGVPLPVSPTVTVASIAGINVPVQPGNAYTLPDVIINPAAPANVPIIIKTTNVPDGTTATFYIATDTNFSPAAPDIVTTATIKTNTATLNVTLPQGVNRLFVRAVF
jgi:hypothetical protein